MASNSLTRPLRLTAKITHPKYTANCPNDCSRRGQCKLRPDRPLNDLLGQANGSLSWSLRRSFAFQTLSASRRRNSICPNGVERTSQLNEFNLLHDQRLEWTCQCDPGFTGSDCSQPRELQCDNQRDDDGDGLVDCEDDDCCSQPVCRDSVCFKSPEPSRVLENRSLDLDALRRPSELDWSPKVSFYHNFRFMIADDSVQSYAQEKTFDKYRAAIVRGRVVRSDDGGAGIVSVRVSVVENAQFGFTLSREDGYFDMLVNGDEWITLQFHRNAYVPLKRRIFVRAKNINLLEDQVEMRLVNGNNPISSSDTSQSNKFGTSFGLKQAVELHKLVTSAAKQLNLVDEQQNRLLECLMSRQWTEVGGFVRYNEPKILEQTKNPPASKDFELTSSESYRTKIEVFRQPLKLQYDSASFPPAASILKPSVTIQLLAKNPHQPKHLKLNRIHVQFSIEGQSSREQLRPLPKLSYTFSWNRRNVYAQKVYGFSPLSIRVGYEYERILNESSAARPLWSDCMNLVSRNGLTDESQASLDKLERKLAVMQANSGRRVAWFEGLIYIQAHQLNQHTDLGGWNLERLTNRLDAHRETLHLSSGRSIPLRLIYPPTVSSPVQLQSHDQATSESSESAERRLLARGPNNSVFVLLRRPQSRLIQLAHDGTRRLLDIPLSLITSRMNSGLDSEEDAHLVYNQHQSTLYVGSKSNGKIVQVSQSSLLAMNRTQTADEETDVEPLCGFGRQSLSSVLTEPSSYLKLCRSMRLSGPHSMSLDEQRQILYFVDGSATLVALDLSSNLLALLVSPKQATLNASRRASEPQVCRRSDLQLSLADYKPLRLSSLSWSRSDESLYFIDQNTVFALRQDQSIELIAFGSRPARADFIQSLPLACLASKSRRLLGQVKSIAVDETNRDLVLVHQWDRKQEESEWEPEEEPKMYGRFYLAKVKLGIRSNDSNRLLDLHSRSVWDSNILRVFGSGQQEPRNSINWTELAFLDYQGWRARYKSSSSIPFIHLSGGFDRIDSIEISSDGSIFALDSRDHSMRIVSDYSANEFNQLESDTQNENDNFDRSNGLFISANIGQELNQLENSNSPNGRLIVRLRHPTSRELMDFDAFTGLQRGLSVESGENIKYELQYQWSNSSHLDEDDRNDFQLQQALKISNGRALVRLNKLRDLTNGNEWQFPRSMLRSRLVTKSIDFNGDPIAQMSTDFDGLLTGFYPISPTSNIQAVELIYDAKTYLLREELTKFDQVHNIRHSTGPNWRPAIRQRLKRIVYDRIFFHYCDLFYH